MKKLIIVGNKVIDKDISKEVESFDMIVRLNRMNNWGKTGTRTDYLLVDPHKNFFKLLEPPFEKYQTAENLIINKNFYNKNSITEMLKLNLFSITKLSKATKLNLQEYSKNILNDYPNKNMRLTNFFIFLKYIIEHYHDRYEIWFTGVDVEHRCDYIKTDPGLDGHRDAANYEQDELLKMIHNRSINYLDPS